MRHFFLPGLLLAGLAGAGVLAEEALSPAERLLHAIEGAPVSSEIEEQVWSDYPALPAEEALKPDVLERYRALLDQEDCEAVLPLLFDAYLSRHPEIKGAFISDKVAGSWRGTVVNRAYPEYVFCTAKKELAEELARLREQGIEFAPYGGMYTVQTPSLAARERNRLMHGIEWLAHRDYVPAIRLFLEMEGNPKLVRMDPAQRVYLLHRLRLLGAPFPDQEARETAAAAALPPRRVRQMLCQAEMGPASLEEVNLKCFKDDNR